MRPSSSPSEGLFGGVLGRGGASGEVADDAWMRALLDVESALAASCADAGLVPPEAAAAIVRACADPGRYDIAALGTAAADDGNPVVPLVRAICDVAGRDASAWVHLGATSQDVLDTATVLVARRAVVHVIDDLAGAADAAGRLARTHRDTEIIGRTLLQQAIPTTFGLKAAGWSLALDHAGERVLQTTDALPLQLGGAAGTLAGYGDRADQVVAGLATFLGLPAPVLPWHTARGPLADLAGALGAAGGAVGKVALDVCLLAQSEVAEVHEGTAGRGGSSAMPHKHNPVAAISARAAALQGPGLVASMLTSMAQEHERAAGAWQAEWETLGALLRSTGSAASWLRDCLEGLVVDSARMAANLETGKDGLVAQRLADTLTGDLGRPSAHDLVAAAADRARAGGRTLLDELADDPGCPYDAAHLAALVAPSVDHAVRLVDRALSARTPKEPQP